MTILKLGGEIFDIDCIKLLNIAFSHSTTAAERAYRTPIKIIKNWPIESVTVSEEGCRGCIVGCTSKSKIPKNTEVLNLVLGIRNIFHVDFISREIASETHQTSKFATMVLSITKWNVVDRVTLIQIRMSWVVTLHRTMGWVSCIELLSKCSSEAEVGLL